MKKILYTTLCWSLTSTTILAPHSSLAYFPDEERIMSSSRSTVQNTAASHPTWREWAETATEKAGAWIRLNPITSGALTSVLIGLIGLVREAVIKHEVAPQQTGDAIEQPSTAQQADGRLPHNPWLVPESPPSPTLRSSSPPKIDGTLDARYGMTGYSSTHLVMPIARRDPTAPLDEAARAGMTVNTPGDVYNAQREENATVSGRSIQTQGYLRTLGSTGQMFRPARLDGILKAIQSLVRNFYVSEEDAQALAVDFHRMLPDLQGETTDWLHLLDPRTPEKDFSTPRELFLRSYFQYFIRRFLGGTGVRHTATLIYYL